MTCPVTSKNYSICCDNGKDKENTKFMFQNQLQSLFPLTPVIIAPEYITTDVAHSIRLVEIIPKNTYPRVYLTCPGKLFAYIERFLGYDMHIACDKYNCKIGVNLEF